MAGVGSDRVAALVVGSQHYGYLNEPALAYEGIANGMVPCEGVTSEQFAGSWRNTKIFGGEVWEAAERSRFAE